MTPEDAKALTTALSSLAGSLVALLFLLKKRELTKYYDRTSTKLNRWWRGGKR